MSKSPKLRFKEFSGDWEKKKLGKITKLTDGVHFTPTYVESGVPFWSVETVVSNAKPKYITEEAHKEAIKRCYPQVDDILLTRIGTLAKPKLIDWNEEFSIYVSLALIKASTNYNSKFARYYFETEYYQKDFLSKSLLTATPKKINMEDLKQTNIKLPSKEEQEKVASFFSLIDDKISLQGEKVEALKDYKRGMMQKIFSRELRFKDDEGRDYPEWEEKKLGEICEVVGRIGFRGYTVDDIVSDPKDGALSLSPSNITEQKLTLDKKTYISKEKYEESPEIKVYNGDIVFVKTASIGKLALISNLDEDATINPQLCIFKNIKIDNKYFYYLLTTDYIQRQINRDIGGGVLNTLTQASIKDYRIVYPCINEQLKIGSVLSSIDSKIEKEQEKLDSLNEYKKGLLQQMFV